MDIILIRHGETYDNVNMHISSKEVKLTDRGRRQIEKAKAILDKLSFDRVYVSPLARAIETMEILGLEGDKEERIREVDFGLFEGKTYDQLQAEFAEELKMWFDDVINYVVPEGESIKMAYDRVVSFLEELVDKKENALLICHDGVIKIALSWVFDNPEFFFKFKIDNGSISIISIDEMGFKYIKKANYTVK
ncbi:MAG: histidine phosphatase family protein [Tissierellales bacterium]